MVGKRKVKAPSGIVTEYWYLFYTNPNSGKPTKMSSGIEVGSFNDKERLDKWLKEKLPTIEATTEAAGLKLADDHSRFISMHFFFETILDHVYKNTRYKNYLIYKEVFKKFGNYLMTNRKVEKLSNIKLETIGVSDIEGYKDERLKHVKGVSAHAELRTIRSAFNIAIELYEDNLGKHIAKNPVRKKTMEGKWKNDKRKAVVLSRADEKVLFKAVKDENLRDIYFVLLKTGMRPAELVNLKWNNVDLDRQFIYVRDCPIEKAKVKEKNKVVRANSTEKRPFRYEAFELKTEESERDLPMNDDIVPIFEKRKQALGNVYDINNYVFANPSGKAYTVDYLNHCLRDIIDSKVLDLGLDPDLHLYSLRHSYATRLKEAGQGIDDIQKLMGHADIATTIENYTHENMESKRSIVNCV